MSWQIIDPIQAGWDASDAALPTAQGWRTETAPPLEFYEKGAWVRPAPTACWLKRAAIGASVAAGDPGADVVKVRVRDATVEDSGRAGGDPGG